MIRPKNETEDIPLQFFKIWETPIKQTHRKALDTIEIRLTKPRETFSFKPPIQIEGLWMIRLTSLEVYNFIFNITEEIYKFEIYTDTFDEFSIEELEDEVEEKLSIPDINSHHLRHEKTGPRIVQTSKKEKLAKSSTDGYIILLLGYARSLVRDCESYLRIVVGLDEDDIQITLKQNNSNFVTYEKSPGVYTTKDISDAVYTKGDHERTTQVEYDDIRRKAKLFLTRFGSRFGTLRVDEIFFSNFFIRLHTLLGLYTYEFNSC